MKVMVNTIIVVGTLAGLYLFLRLVDFVLQMATSY